MGDFLKILYKTTLYTCYIQTHWSTKYYHLIAWLVTVYADFFSLEIISKLYNILFLVFSKAKFPLKYFLSNNKQVAVWCLFINRSVTLYPGPVGCAMLMLQIEACTWIHAVLAIDLFLNIRTSE